MHCCKNADAKKEVSISEPMPHSNDDNGDDLPEVLCLLHLKRSLELYKSTRERLAKCEKENDALFKDIQAMEEELPTSANDLFKESKDKNVDHKNVLRKSYERDIENSKIGLMSDAELTSRIREVEEENASFMLEIKKCKERIRNMERDGSERNRVQLERSKELEATIRNLEMDTATLRENLEKLDKDNIEMEGSLKKFKQRAMVAEVSGYEMDWTVHQLKAQLAAWKATKDEAVLQNSSVKKRVVDMEESSQRDPATPKADKHEFAEKEALIEALLAKDVLILKQRENLHKSLNNQEELMELLKIVQNKNKETFSVNIRQLKQAHKADLDAVKESIRMTSIRSPLLKSESGKFKTKLEDMSRLEDGLIHQIEKNEELQMVVVENQQEIARLSRQLEEANIEIGTIRETHDILGWMMPGQSSKRSPSPVKKDTGLPYQKFLSPTREALLADSNERTSPRGRGRVSPIEAIGSVIKRLISPDRDGRDRSLSPRRPIVSVTSSNKREEETGTNTKNVKVNVGPGPSANERNVTDKPINTSNGSYFPEKEDPEKNQKISMSLKYSVVRSGGAKSEIPAKRGNTFERKSYGGGRGKNKQDDRSGLDDSESKVSWKSFPDFSEQTRTQPDMTRPKRDGLSDHSQSEWETDSSYSDVEEGLMKGVFEMQRSRRELAKRMKTLESETDGSTEGTSYYSDTALQEEENGVSAAVRSLKERVTDTTWTEEMKATAVDSDTATKVRKNLEDAFSSSESLEALDTKAGIRPPTVRFTDDDKILKDVANSRTIHSNANSRDAQETSEGVMTPGEAVMKLHGNL